MELFTHAKSETTKATRYVLIFTDVLKWVVISLPFRTTDLTGMFEAAQYCGLLLCLILIVKLALKDGSSKQGKALLASVGSNCVVARYRFVPSKVV